MKRNTERMSYETYSLIRDVLEDRIVKLENDFRNATQFIPGDLTEANKIFQKELTSLYDAKEQLRSSVAMTYRNHPNKEMRKFWET